MNEQGHVFGQPMMETSTAGHPSYDHPQSVPQQQAVDIPATVTQPSNDLTSGPQMSNEVSQETHTASIEQSGQATAQDAMSTSGNMAYQPILLSGTSMPQQSVIPVDPAMINALQNFLQGTGQPVVSSSVPMEDSGEPSLGKRKRTNYRQPENAAKLTGAVNVLVSRYQQNADRNVDIKSVSRMFGVPYNTLRDNFIKACTGRPIKSRRRSNKGGNTGSDPSQQGGDRIEGAADEGEGNEPKDGEAGDKDDPKPKRQRRSRALPPPFQFQPQIFAIAQPQTVGSNGQQFLQQPQYVIAMQPPIINGTGANGGGAATPQFAQIIPFTGSILPQNQLSTLVQPGQIISQTDKPVVEGTEGTSQPIQVSQQPMVSLPNPVILSAAPGAEGQQVAYTLAPNISTMSIPAPSQPGNSTNSASNIPPNGETAAPVSLSEDIITAHDGVAGSIENVEAHQVVENS